ncbi:hypothetical protein CSB37_02720 [bacterium DOLZORAL124_38_8]|nr:MAG: hypothetical protein CSB37_02720 [bacterium DOLZORAL124_38_8]
MTVKTETPANKTDKSSDKLDEIFAGKTPKKLVEMEAALQKAQADVTEKVADNTNPETTTADNETPQEPEKTNPTPNQPAEEPRKDEKSSEPEPTATPETVNHLESKETLPEPSENQENTTDTNSISVDNTPQPEAKKDEPIDIEKIDIDSSFEKFLKSDTAKKVIPTETLKKAQESLKNPEARGLLNSISTMLGIDSVNLFVEPTVIGPSIFLGSALATSILYIKYQAIVMGLKNIVLRYKNRHSEHGGAIANKGMWPFSIGNFQLIRTLTKKHPELINTFFAHKMSQKARNRIAEAQEKIEQESTQKIPNIDEIEYWKKQLIKWQEREEQSIKSGLNFVPKWGKRLNKIKNFPKKVWNFLSSPFRRKKNSEKVSLSV